MILCQTGAELLEHAHDFLASNEAANNLIFGILSALEVRSRTHLAVPNQPQPFLAVFGNPRKVDGGANAKVTGVAIKTPPHNLVLTHAAKEDLKTLAHFLKRRAVSLPGVTGPREQAEFFAEIWTTLNGGASYVHMNLVAHELTSLIAARPVRGHMRLATVAEQAKLIQWCDAFGDDANLREPRESEQVIKQYLGENRLYVWDTTDRAIVSMAGWSGRTSTGVRINMVYTPPELRAQGFASALVSELTKLLLASDRERCFLFTDKANPTSNSIYKKLGYNKVCELIDIKFT